MSMFRLSAVCAFQDQDRGASGSAFRRTHHKAGRSSRISLFRLLMKAEGGQLPQTHGPTTSPTGYSGSPKFGGKSQRGWKFSGVSVRDPVRNLVGVAGFEPATPSSRTRMLVSLFIPESPYVPCSFTLVSVDAGRFGAVSVRTFLPCREQLRLLDMQCSSHFGQMQISVCIFYALLAAIAVDAAFWYDAEWWPYTRSSISTVIPKNPAACHGSTPACMSQVAHEWRKVWGMTSVLNLPLTTWPSLAFLAADLEPFFTESTEEPFQLMTLRMPPSSRFQRRRWAISRSGIATGG
jgi:hypothetical protein